VIVVPGKLVNLVPLSRVTWRRKAGANSVMAQWSSMKLAMKK